MPCTIEAALLVLGLVLAPSAGRVEPPAPPIPGYTLAWSDEFTGAAGAPDQAKWKPWAIGDRRDAVNIAEAARLDGSGHLVITTARAARSAPGQGAPAVHGTESAESRVSPWSYTTGGVWTEGLFEPTFGYFEARIRFHSRLGHWGAFWLNCASMGFDPEDAARAPTGGARGGVEMDIVEFHHRMKTKEGQVSAQQTLHWDGYAKDHKTRGHTPGVSFDPAADFHVYGMLWTAEQYVFFIDGVETWRVRKAAPGIDDKGKGLPPVSPSTRPEHLILSLEVGDWAGKPPQRDAESWPDSMTVDWVRVWQAPGEK